MHPTAPSKLSHCEQYPGELFRGNMTTAEFNRLPFNADPEKGTVEKRMGLMAFDEDGAIIHKGDQPPSLWVYPVFVRRSAVVEDRKELYGIKAAGT